MAITTAAISFLVLPSLVRAEANLEAEADAGSVSVPAESVSTSTVVPPTEAKVFGLVDLRPSWTSRNGEYHTEETLQLGYQFNAKYSVDAVYYFNTNLYNPSDANMQGLGFTSQDGFLRGKINKIYEKKDLNLALNYDARFYLPVAQTSIDQGRILVLRNYLNLVWTPNSVLKLTFTELPILHAYARAGFVYQGTPTANTAFENRNYIVADIAITKKFNLALPLMLHTIWNRDYDAAASFNGQVNFIVYTWPELTYTINDNFAVALSAYSDNLIAPDFSGLTIGSGLEKTVYQVSFQAML